MLADIATFQDYSHVFGLAVDILALQHSGIEEASSKKYVPLKSVKITARRPHEGRTFTDSNKFEQYG